VSAVDTVELEVRELVRRRGLDPVTDRLGVRRLVEEVVADYDERALTSALAPLPDSRQAARSVYDAVAGFGPLQRHLDDPTIEELWINEPGRVFVARRGRSELTTTILGEAQARELVEKMLKTTGRRVDLSTPFVDAMLSYHPGRARSRSVSFTPRSGPVVGLPRSEAVDVVPAEDNYHLREGTRQLLESTGEIDIVPPAGPSSTRSSSTHSCDSANRSAPHPSSDSPIWNKLSIDVSAWNGRRSVVSLSVSFAAVGSTYPTWDPRFQIDDVGYLTS